MSGPPDRGRPVGDHFHGTYVPVEEPPTASQKAAAVKQLAYEGRFRRAGTGPGRDRHGHGADVAMESAAVTLVKGDLRGILRARHLSRATIADIRRDLFFVFNAATMPIAAGALYPLDRLSATRLRPRYVRLD